MSLTRNAGGPFAVAEQVTIGDTTASRWIGSAAQDRQGNLAVGYNFGNEGKQPSLNYTGRLASEPAGTVRDEASLVNGSGVQKAFGFRWGDYSGMSVDPADDCTFWMTGEYYTHDSEEFSDFTWLTRIWAISNSPNARRNRSGRSPERLQTRLLASRLKA